MQCALDTYAYICAFVMDKGEGGGVKGELKQGSFTTSYLITVISDICAT